MGPGPGRTDIAEILRGIDSLWYLWFYAENIRGFLLDEWPLKI
jgi:hypothetical protein